MKILLAADEQKSRRMIAFGLQEAGVDARIVTSVSQLLAEANQPRFDAVVLDWEMRSAAAPELLAAMRDGKSPLPVLVLTSDAAIGPALAKAGATAHLLKPFSMTVLMQWLRTHAQSPAADSLAPSPAQAGPPARTAGEAEESDASGPQFASRNVAMQKILQLAWRAADTDATVLLLGENGTGKSVLAAEMHRRSRRRARPFATANCPSFHPQLLESELFGHVRGAFTGAVIDAQGKVAAAEGGTLFLDEIGDLPLEIQSKLLRFLQDREYERVGEPCTHRADIRVIAATNRDLAAEVAAGRFREDLYYRLNVIRLEVLPLRRRREDIVPTAEEFLAQISRGMGRSFRGFTLPAQQAFQTYHWPGNLRELRNAVERAAILSESDLLDADDFNLPNGAGPGSGPQIGDFVSLAEIECAHINEVVSRVTSYAHAARILGIDKSTLYRKRRRQPERLIEFAAEQPPATGTV
ncbi:MAG TPA: sigma-54 dependent transcriptional regulator [Opitutaceae bacterium]